jgi:hypothetical protein
MKATHASTKTRQNHSQSKPSLGRNDAQLFLGHKVLGELRILMRLATPTDSATNTNDGSSGGRSY